MPEPCHISAASERFALAEAFVISRGAKTSADVVVCTIRDNAGNVGRGEAVPYPRYGETVERTLQEIAAYRGALDRQTLLQTMPAGAARNAIDCALWDLDAKATTTPAHRAAGLVAMPSVETAYTLSLSTPESMAERAKGVPHLKLLKLKLGGAGDDTRMKAVRAARPDARLIVDANEAWTADLLQELLEAAREAAVELIEQPLPAGTDEALALIERVVPVCADESAHVAADLAPLRDRYDAVNIKLDKAGGLTAALQMRDTAKALGLRIMVGSMVSTSLGVAPAMILARDAAWVDLDGPLLLAHDRSNGLAIANGIIAPPSRLLWG